MKLLIPLLWLFSLSALANDHKTGQISNDYSAIIKAHQYDSIFKKYGDNSSKILNPKMLKAVCGVESRLNPKAMSKEKARGLCQIVPSTWKSIVKKNKGIPINGYFDPDHSVHASSIILKDITLFWKSIPKDQAMVSIMLASYNAGVGNVQKAMNLCKSKNYTKFKTCLSSITSDANAKQTTNYVKNVELLYSQLNN